MPHSTSDHSFGRLATGAAFGLLAGLAIPHARKAVMQGPALAAGDWVAGLTAEHRMVEKMFDTLLATSDEEMLKREMLLTKIAYALTKHAIEEENVIYPALSENAHAEQAHHLVDDHAKAKTFIYDLRRISSRDPQWLLRAREFWTDLQEHMRQEEDEIFPTFRDALPAEENARLTKMMNWEGFKVA
ncbi:hemerythrin domain-containing protein [Phenylobacterium hankyongense]|uniref:Hemerythrin domain-containing protein n=1 Tax=Phenylobacterium hankyongense TaxID=1813876 RepID=A0A328AXI0_9CAUL|nr:hemerythrin domain-containing protein [Phenylobacterium hankyongense]RAK59673.1 hemerythrin domain-containing protein [Phenylobacterium hankyongense]